MENRLRFLYCCISELWGHRRRCTGAEWKAACKRRTRLAGKTVSQWEAVKRTEMIVGKCVSRLSRKAAIVYTVPVP